MSDGVLTFTLKKGFLALGIFQCIKTLKPNSQLLGHKIFTIIFNYSCLVQSIPSPPCFFLARLAGIEPAAYRFEDYEKPRKMSIINGVEWAGIGSNRGTSRHILGTKWVGYACK